MRSANFGSHGGWLVPDSVPIKLVAMRGLWGYPSQGFCRRFHGETVTEKTSAIERSNKNRLQPSFRFEKNFLAVGNERNS